jgi:hypothetical protein
MKQHEAVIKCLERLGGAATLGQLYNAVLKISDCRWNTKTPFASIRRIVQTRPEIYKIKPGLYGLIAKKADLEGRGILQETPSNKTLPETVKSNHAYYQGLLLCIGAMRHFQTFAPRQDKNKRFIDKPLGELSTLNAVPPFSYDRFVKRIATVDVAWFNQRGMPSSLFEVELTTDIQNSLLKFADLQDFRLRAVIVADKARRKEYEKKIACDAFKEIKESVMFLDLDCLVRQYENLMQTQDAEVQL